MTSASGVVWELCVLPLVVVMAPLRLLGAHGRRLVHLFT